jgi:hypothetical protein
LIVKLRNVVTKSRFAGACPRYKEKAEFILGFFVVGSILRRGGAANCPRY